MKKLNLLLAIIIGLSILSCSSDDNNNQQAQSTQLIKVEQKGFFDGIFENKSIYKYNNNKLELVSFYNSTNELIGYSNWVYSSQGLLIKINDFSADDSQTRELKITYDSQNRIIQTNITFLSGQNNNHIVNFTHNSDNTINSLFTYTGNGSTEEKIFEINNNGLIDKEIQNGNVVVSVQYSNLKVLTIMDNFTNYTYTYHETGINPFDFWSGIVGENHINAVLFNNSLRESADTLGTNLIKEIATSITIQKFVYTLNENDFPLTLKSYRDGEIEYEYEYFYN